eukprot:scaffold269200_cov22-Prasinocladus_malaysianus.AAC.1
MNSGPLMKYGKQNNFRALNKSTCSNSEWVRLQFVQGHRHPVSQYLELLTTRVLLRGFVHE